VVLHVRADEAYHAMFNHHLSDQCKTRPDEEPTPPELDVDPHAFVQRSPSFIPPADKRKPPTAAK